VAVMELAVADGSPAPDVARTGASLAASGNTPTAWLASHLASNGYERVEAARIGRALQTMGTPASGCADAACAAQLGRAIGAELVVFGRVIKVSDLIWLVEATLVDTGQGRILRSEQLELKGDVAQLLPRSMRSMARRLAALERIDLSGANLREASLYATILTGAVLVEADLTRARIISTMSGVKLTRAKLAGADLGADPGNQPMGIMRTDATGADLAQADLTSANLRKVNFTRADLSGADLTGADVSGADFTGAILRVTPHHIIFVKPSRPYSQSP